MFEIPSPYRRPSRSNPRGWKPSIPRSHGSRPEYDVSVWPLSISVGPPPAPSQIPRTLARPSSICCHWTDIWLRSSSSWISSASACSEPVKLGVETKRTARSTSSPRSMRILRPLTASSTSSELRQHLVAEQADLVVPSFAPQLEHHVRAAGVAVLLDRLDAVGGRACDRPALVEQRVVHQRLRRHPPAALHRIRDRPDLLLFDPREVEERVGSATDVLHLVREIHRRDLARAVAPDVAVRLVDRRDDRAADVDVG